MATAFAVSITLPPPIASTKSARKSLAHSSAFRAKSKRGLGLTPPAVLKGSPASRRRFSTRPIKPLRTALPPPYRISTRLPPYFLILPAVFASASFPKTTSVGHLNTKLCTLKNLSSHKKRASISHSICCYEPDSPSPPLFCFKKDFHCLISHVFVQFAYNFKRRVHGNHRYTNIHNIDI